MEKFAREKAGFLELDSEDTPDSERRIARKGEERRTGAESKGAKKDKEAAERSRILSQLNLKVMSKRLNAKQKKSVKRAIHFMLVVDEGRKLANDLVRLIRNPTTRDFKSRITVIFVDEFRGSEEGSSGNFKPGERQASKYTVFVKYIPPRRRIGNSIDLGRYYPQSGLECSVFFSFTHPELQMAETVFHELLHIWFLNSQTDATYPTGHKNIMKCEIEPLFLKRLKNFASQMGRYETQRRRAAR